MHHVVIAADGYGSNRGGAPISYVDSELEIPKRAIVEPEPVARMTPLKVPTPLPFQDANVRHHAEPIDFSVVKKKDKTDKRELVRSLLRSALSKTNVSFLAGDGESIHKKEKIERRRNHAVKSEIFSALKEEIVVPVVTTNCPELNDKNICPYCSKKFLYRSSYRRHIKIHQGIFSHMCNVCGRKFTRKEHYIRHKCNRRPNKLNRGREDGGSLQESQIFSEAMTTSLPSDVIAELGEHGEIIKAESPGSRAFESSFSGEMTDEDLTPAHESSRRKSSTPRKVIFNDDEAGDEKFAEGDDIIDASFDQTRSLSAVGVETDDCDDFDNSDVAGCFADGEMLSTPNKTGSVYNVSPVRAYDAPPPSYPDTGHPTFSPTASYGPSTFLKLHTGNYKVSEEAGECTVGGGLDGGGSEVDRVKVITIKKQGKYLKLKNEAHIVNGSLCFSCPHCAKTFHRSSNFSRHMRIHRGVYSYVCQTCARGFFRREHFQKHKCHRKSMVSVCDRQTKFDLLRHHRESSSVADRSVSTEDASDVSQHSAYLPHPPAVRHSIEALSTTL